MTLTRKVGALLLLLTAGSLIGSAAFALFFSNTTSDGLFLVAGTLRQSMLQQLYIHALMIRQGNDVERGNLPRLIRDTDLLIAAMEEGGVGAGGTTLLLPFSTAGRVQDIVADRSLEGRATEARIAEALAEGLPEPPEELQANGKLVHELWSRNHLPEALQTVADLPLGDPRAEEAFGRLQSVRENLLEASAEARVLVMDRIVRQRGHMVAILASIAGLSLFLLAVGLWYTQRYISRPIREIEQASSQLRSGDFSHRIPVHSDDELASLARTFNEMSDEIHHQVERYKELFENAADGLFVSDLNWNILSVNKESERMTGYSREELIGMKVDQLIPSEQLEFVRQKMQEKISGGPPTTYELPIHSKAGRIVVTECSTRLVFEGGKPVAVQGVSRDITERKRLQEQLWTAQKLDAVGRLASGLAHDFGNVLTVITGYSALILATLKPGDPIRPEVEGIQRSAHRATSMIRHLLSFSSGQVFRPRVISVQPMLIEMMDMLRRLIGEDVQLKTHIEPGTGAIRMDPGQLEQVIVNLALNARDAMPSGGTVLIDAAPVDLEKESYVRIRLHDNGLGMPREILGRIFEPFFSTKTHGTGLGLSTVQAIIRQTGGTISVESHVDKGTTFTLLIPRVSGEENLKGEEYVTAPRRGTETVLLVEDETDVRALIRDTLRVYGYNVVEAEDPQHALELCRRSDLKLDALLTDVVMPNMSGPELAKSIQRMRPSLKVIFMSGHARDRFEASGIDVETVNFIQKPVIAESLTARLREVLDAKPS